jgi:hypothetical protein
MIPRALISLLSIFLFAQSSYGQQLTKPDFVATYNFRCIKDTVANEYNQPKPFLLITKGKSSRFHHAYAQFNDSIVEAFTAANPIPQSYTQQESLNRSKRFSSHYQKYKKPFAMWLWAEKDLRNGLVAGGPIRHIPPFHLEVALPLPWEPSGGTIDTINGIACRMAELDYGGRRWTAHYSTAIAVPEGPYVFCGLPGLIVRIEDDRGWYRFDLTSFEPKPKGKYFWHDYYYNVHSEQLTRVTYVTRALNEMRSPSLPISSTEEQLLEMKQRFSKYYWYLLEQR